jgi:hypothetical protein
VTRRRWISQLLEDEERVELARNRKGKIGDSSSKDKQKGNNARRRYESFNL